MQPQNQQQEMQQKYGMPPQGIPPMTNNPYGQVPQGQSPYSQAPMQQPQVQQPMQQVQQPVQQAAPIPAPTPTQPAKQAPVEDGSRQQQQRNTKSQPKPPKVADFGKSDYKIDNALFAYALCASILCDTNISIIMILISVLFFNRESRNYDVAKCSVKAAYKLASVYIGYVMMGIIIDIPLRLLEAAKSLFASNDTLYKVINIVYAPVDWIDDNIYLLYTIVLTIVRITLVAQVMSNSVKAPSKVDKEINRIFDEVV